QDLNALSYRSAGSSHPYSLMFEDDRVLVFTFANINLPDSASDPLGSQGFVAYTLQHAGSLSPGTQIDNRAAIYFDYNAPIITNTVQNTIFTYPEVSMTTLSGSEICVDDSVRAALSVPGTGPYTYRWNNGEQGQNGSGNFNAMVDSTRFYAVIVSDALGFETSDSVFVNVKPMPIADIGVVSRTAPLTYRFQSASQNASTYLWDFGDGSPVDSSQNPVHLYVFDGFYTVTHIAINECGADTVTIENFLTENIKDDFIRSVQVVPNPFTEQTQIRFDNPQGKAYRLRLYDQHGKLVRQYAEQRGNHFEIERGDLSAGLYLFEIQHESGRYTAKLMIQ
ncbi:MAG: PKD domain-containing protein, partial [Bacteroidota bacterium]